MDILKKLFSKKVPEQTEAKHPFVIEKKQYRENEEFGRPHDMQTKLAEFVDREEGTHYLIYKKK